MTKCEHPDCGKAAQAVLVEGAGTHHVTCTFFCGQHAPPEAKPLQCPNPSDRPKPKKEKPGG